MLFRDLSVAQAPRGLLASFVRGFAPSREASRRRLMSASPMESPELIIRLDEPPTVMPTSSAPA